MSHLVETLLFQLRAARLPTPECEYRFHETRRWRFDLAFVSEKFAIEVDGGTWVQGRHSRGAGYEKDCEKYAEAIALGWRVLRVTGGMVKTGKALEYAERILKGE